MTGRENAAPTLDRPQTRDSITPMTDTAPTAALTPTPSDDSLPRRYSDFATLGEALDYAARGTRGLNFHDRAGCWRGPIPMLKCAAMRWRRPID